jgi:HEAT repeat protein
MDLLKQIGEPAVDPLIAALASRDWRVVLLASRILGDLAPPRAVDPLTRAAKHSRWVVRESAVTALGKIGEPHSLPALRETLAKDRSPQVRKSAAFALGEIGGEGVVTPLVTALADERGIVRETARTSLASLDSLAVPALCQVINAGTAGVGSRPPRAVALSLEALRGMGRGLPAAELHALTGSYLWREAEIRMATARVIAATRQATTHQPLTVADHEASLQVFADLLRDPDARVRALAEGLRAEASPGLAAGIE